MKRILLCLISAAAFCGCTTTAVPVVKEALKCEVPASMLAACSDAAAVKSGISFGEMIDVSSRDRDSLRECALRHKSLADAITDCNSRIDKYNADIREYNARNAAK
jgi:hypothetical protein